MHGQNPVLSTETIDHKDRLEMYGSELLEMHNEEFISSDTKFLSIPDQDRNTFDPYLADMMSTFINVTQHPLMRAANWPDVRKLRELRGKTIWDLVLDSQPVDTRAMISRLHAKHTIVDTWAIKESPYFTGLYYSSVQRLTWPLSASTEFTTYELSDSVPRADLPVVEPTVPADPPVAPLIVPVKTDEFYVLSEAFYISDRPNQSQLELLVTMMLNRERIPSEQLVELCSVVYAWDSLERYYYIPLILVLIQYVIRGL
jgi:hypothetical protein